MPDHIPAIGVDSSASVDSRLKPVGLTAADLTDSVRQLTCAPTETSRCQPSINCSKKRDELTTFGLRRV
jgi:hypothetical protein